MEFYDTGPEPKEDPYQTENYTTIPDVLIDLLHQIDLLPNSLAGIYERELSRLREREQMPIDLVHSIFRWIIYAKRTLSIEELVEAVGAPQDIRNSGVAIKLIYIKRAGGSFVQFEQNSARLVHFSVRDYFKALESASAAEATNRSMAARCLDCLLSCTSPEISDINFREQPLLRYAAEYWYRHLQALNGELLTDEILGLCTKFFDLKAPQPFLNWLRIFDPDQPGRGMQLDAKLGDFPPQSRYIELCCLSKQNGIIDGAVKTPDQDP